MRPRAEEFGEPEPQSFRTSLDRDEFLEASYVIDGKPRDVSALCWIASHAQEYADEFMLTRGRSSMTGSLRSVFEVWCASRFGRSPEPAALGILWLEVQRLLEHPWRKWPSTSVFGSAHEESRWIRAVGKVGAYRGDALAHVQAICREMGLKLDDLAERMRMPGPPPSEAEMERRADRIREQCAQLREQGK